MAPTRQGAHTMEHLREQLTRLGEELEFHRSDNQRPQNEVTKGRLQARLCQLEKISEEFLELYVHRQRANVSVEDEQEFKVEADIFRDRYFETIVSTKDKLNAMIAAEPPIAAPQGNAPPARAPPVKTQRIPLPEFDGTPDKWIKYRDMFLSLIHNSEAYSDIEKFHYLQSSMKIPSNESNVLTIFPHTADNYKRAWEAVCKRYDDKRKLLNHHLSSLFSIKKMNNDSASELRRIIDAFESHISSLAQLGFAFTEDDPYPNLIYVFMICRSLDEETLREWKKDTEDDTPTYVALRTFLLTQWRSLDDIPASKKSTQKVSEVKPNRTGKALVSNNETKSTFEMTCNICNDRHWTSACSKFLAMSVEERFKVVKEKKLCFNCLNKTHAASQCQSKYKCKKCEKSHHTLLHLDRQEKHVSSRHESSVSSSSSKPLSPEVPPFQPFNMSKQTHFAESEEAGTASHSTTFMAKTQTLLSTVVVYAVDSFGKNHPCRALLDSGSDTSFITTKFAKQLKMKFRDACFPITGIDDKTTIVKHKVKVDITSRYGPFDCTMDCSVLANITGILPNQSISKERLEIPEGYFLADPKFNDPADIDMLISSDIFYESLLTEKLKLPNGLMMLETKFGWIMGGTMKTNICHRPSMLSCFQHKEKIDDDEIDMKLDAFFRADEFESNPKCLLTAEEKYCEETFIKTTVKDDQGKFVVRMPFKSTVHSLGNNLVNAKRALTWQESRRRKDSTYNELYVEYMDDYEATGHMEEISSDSNEKAYYLPHHGVLKMSSTSTKLRPVFNASSVSETGISLNDVLCVGPIVQPESFDILLRFREKPFVITGDITKMYRQIWVHPSQRNFLRILWRADMNAPVKHYQLNTVTFGTSCAPFLATRVIKQLAIENRETFPQASVIIDSCFYVDDLLFGVDSIDEGITVLTHIRYILVTAGMPLCKMTSNHPDILEGIPDSDIANDDDNQVTKMLGIGYKSSSDLFSYHLKPPTDGELTKAKVLSEIASIYDPIGWIGPIVLKAKLFLKKLWLRKLQWKDVIPDDMKQEWNNFRELLSLVNNVKINRQCFINNHVRVELHGFCDASIEAYGAVIYAHSYDQAGHTKTSIICSKSRIAPKSQKTLARLELCGATLLAKLITRIRSIFSTPIQDIILWSDSTIVLSWITITPSRLSTFVGNRVAVIQELTHSFTWKHIRGVDNPADIISRGMMPNEIEDCDVWWNGPLFFTLTKSQWPSSIITINEDDPEIKEEMKRSLSASTPNDMLTFIETKFSNPRTLRNVIAYVRRFTINTQKNATKLSGPLSVEEIEASETVIIRVVQQAYFPHEYKLLKQRKNLKLSRKSSILSLSPFMSNEEVIRVGGRIHASPELTINQKHPIILPKCHFTKILIRELHMKHAHPGPLLLRSIVRENYYPLKAMTIIRKIIHECLICFRFKSSTTTQIMSDLPAARVTMSPPFTNTAIDYAGFYIIRSSMIQRSSSMKVYIALFKCMCTSAIHLELVSDLTSQAFIAALDRFVSRRGLSTTLYTDNATYFEGADNELKRIVASIEPEVKQHCTNQAIKWMFTTPRAPHAGGVYESGIKLMKHHLKRVMGDKLYNYEQFTTILCKIEAIVNSRPLTPMTENPLDLEVLTPGHFLTGRSLLAKPERNLLDKTTAYLNHWEGIQQVQQRFWSLWYHDYLNTLQSRPADFREQSHFRIGDMVLVKDSNVPPLKWLIGRIVKLFPGKDKMVRNVRIITRLGEKDRHVRYLSVLPFDQEQSSAGESVANAT